MQKIHRYIIFLSFLLPFTGFAQIRFKTVVPQQSIIAGQPFQVQYIVENAGDISNFSLPAFPGFNFVTGPHIYSGNTQPGSDPVYKNMVITLAAIRKGRFRIHGASCMINGKLYRSNDVLVEVISQEEAQSLNKINRTSGNNSVYFLHPGEDPIKKIRENLFLKIMVDHYNCFVGEPLVATFKLYSRLQSRSDILKNPGFYGFSVYDMINTNDKVQYAEKLNGHWFDVHVIRKLQLYPLQAGIFTIDAMELANKIEFSRSSVNKKTEQEITENMYGNKESHDEPGQNTEVYELNMKSDPVTITVKPLPGKTAADTFAGAVGNFSISASVEKDTILKNEESSLILEIRGAGNFQRVNSPAISWPQGIETFDPSVSDSLDVQQVPLTGRRLFKYVFVSDKPGFYTIPSIPFSFFNLKTKTYKTVSTKPLIVFISNKSKVNRSLAGESKPLNPGNKLIWWLSGAALIFIIAGSFVWLGNKRSKRIAIAQEEKINEPVIPSLEDLFLPAKRALKSDDKIFYKELSDAIWNYVRSELRLSGSEMNKIMMPGIFTEKGIEPRLAEELVKILHQCETGIYTNANLDIDKPAIFERTIAILKQLHDSFPAG